jgi:hypothetical protein
LPQLKSQFGASEECIGAEMKKASAPLQWEKVFELAGKFREISELQSDVVKQFNHVIEQIRRSPSRDAGKCPRSLPRSRCGLFFR